jgi:hypothetical protein
MMYNNAERISELDTAILIYRLLFLKCIIIHVRVYCTELYRISTSKNKSLYRNGGNKTCFKKVKRKKKRHTYHCNDVLSCTDLYMSL